MIISTDTTPHLPPAPRAVTRAASRRSWAEPTVRVPLFLTLLVLAITAAYVSQQGARARTVRRLIESGAAVDATVLEINGQKNRNKRFPRSETVAVKFTYTGPDGAKRVVDTNLESLGRNPAGEQSLVFIDMILPLRVDPADNSIWTDRTRVKPWAQEFAVAYALVPLILLLAGLTWLRRRSVLNIWRHGLLAEGIVVDAKQSGIAPLSRIVRYNLKEGTDRRVFSTLVPNRLRPPKAGESLWLLVDPRRSDRAILPRLYEQPATADRPVTAV